jgi:hypothetical protein
VLGHGVGCEDSPAWEALRAAPLAHDADAVAEHDGSAAPDEAAAIGDDDSPRAAGAPTTRTLPWYQRITRKAQHVMAVAAAGAVVLATGAVAWGTIWQKVQAREAGSAIASAMSGLNLPELRVVEAANGHLRIEGTVRSESERAQLMQALQQRGVYPAVDVVSGEQLAGTVQNTFRQHGLHVKAQYAGGGRIDVHGAAASPATDVVVQELLAATNAIKKVALLEPAAAPPSPEAVTAPAAPAANNNNANAGSDPKRVVGVVGGANPFVVTADRRHYSVGSILPDGTQIDRIDGDTVDFSRNGKPMTVRF